MVGNFLREWILKPSSKALGIAYMASSITLALSLAVYLAVLLCVMGSWHPKVGFEFWYGIVNGLGAVIYIAVQLQSAGKMQNIVGQAGAILVEMAASAIPALVVFVGLILNFTKTTTWSYEQMAIAALWSLAVMIDLVSTFTISVVKSSRTIQTEGASVAAGAALH